VNDPRIQAILEQLDTLILLLLRPVVQQQLLAFFMVTLVAWLIPVPFRLLTNWFEQRIGAAPRQGDDTPQPVTWRTRLIRWTRAAEFVLFPLLGLILGGFAVGRLDQNGIPSGLLARLNNLFWLLLTYRVLGAFLFGAVDLQTAQRYHRRFVAPIFLILLAASLSIGLDGTFLLGDIPLVQVMGQALSLRSIITAIVVLYLFLALAWITRDVLNRYVLPRTQADAGVANTIVITTNYAIIGIGILMAATTLGFDLSALTIVFGGLSVGIGFGLQELIANFISGILLVFEQTLRPGDTVEVGGQRGTVTQMRMRATVLRNIDNVEIFVPNKTLLTSTVAAYTFSDRVVRRVISVGVSYDSDPTQVRDILLEVGRSHGLVMADPAPVVFFTAFGESSLNFDLAVWIGNSARALEVVSDLHFMIYSQFTKHGIEIPFPQRDLHLRSVNAPLPIHFRQSNADGPPPPADSKLPLPDVAPVQSDEKENP
jgi:small-conductance mechanosensitive channel